MSLYPSSRGACQQTCEHGIQKRPEPVGAGRLIINESNLLIRFCCAWIPDRADYCPLVRDDKNIMEVQHAA